jgi:hypothetical protein
MALTNWEVHQAIKESLKEIGLEDVGGSDVEVDSVNGIMTTYKGGEYKVNITISN